MPLILPDLLPAIDELKLENIFTMGYKRADSQQIRPLRLAVLNLMPIKITTETDFIRILSNSALQIQVEFMKIKSHTSKNTSQWISNGAEGATAGYFLSFEEADKVLDSISDKSVTDQQNKWEVCSGPASFYNDDVMLIVCTGTDNTEECREIISSVLSDNENAYKLAGNSKRFVNNKTAMKKVLSEHNTESLISSKAIKNKENAFRCYYSNAERIHLNYKFSAYDTSYNKIFLDTVKQYALEQHYSIEDTMSVFFKNAESEFN